MELRELLNKFADRVELAEKTTRLAVQHESPVQAIKNLMREVLEIDTANGADDLDQNFIVKNLVLVGLIGNYLMAQDENISYEMLMSSFYMTTHNATLFRKEYKRESHDENS